MNLNDITVEVRDRSDTRVGAIPPAELDLEVAPIVNGVGTWRVTLPASHRMTPVLRTPGAGIVVTGPGGNVLLSGPVEAPESSRSVDSPAGSVVFGGPCDKHVLWDHVAYPDPTTADTMRQGADHDTRSGAAESVIHGFVAANIGPTAPEGRRVPRLTLGDDGQQGEAVQKSARFDVLGELLSGIADGAGLVFDVKQSGQGRRFTTSARVDRSQTVRLDVNNGTLNGHRVAISAPKVTHVIAGSREVELDRVFTTVATTDSLEASALWGRRIEQFMDQRQALDAGESTQGARDLLARDGITQVVAQVTVSDNLAMRFGIDWDLGDIVTVVVEGQELSAVVTGAVIRVNRDGVRVGVVLGDATGFNPSAAVRRDIERTASRVSNLERNESTPTVVAPEVPSVTVNFATSQTTWVVTHNFNKRPVQVDCIDSDGAVLFGDVAYPTTNGSNVVEIRFGIPMTGSAVVRK